MSRVDLWFDEHDAWPEEVRALRAIVLESGLDETLKWKQPCYTDRGKNILIVSSLKAAATVSFLKGALLKDPTNRLESPGENSRHAKFMRFTSVDQVQRDRALLKDFIAQAIANERAGKRLPKRPDAIEFVEELQERMEGDAAFREAFLALTPGRQRGYNLHIGGAKKSETRVARIEKCEDKIFAGKGFHDCVCGRSKRLPRCDGSHKSLTKG